MANDSIALLNDVLQKDEGALLQSWVDNQVNSPTFRPDRTTRPELMDHSRRFLRQLRDAVKGGDADIMGSSWSAVRQMLDELSLKQPLFDRLQGVIGTGVEALTRLWPANLLLDRLGLYTTEVFQRGREQVIIRQQQELMELSTPVVTLWEGVLALPLIGTLDSARTQVVMESLLQRIVDTGASIAIIDITGVPTVDTVTAQHLLKTVAAARLMGADCIISGIRPQIAQTIVHLGVELGAVVTKATIADAFAIALKRVGLSVQKIHAAPRRRDDHAAEPRQSDDRREA
jgi:rsbT co-antagonist protein RsbR